jgi:hypothetical protein
VLVRDLTLEIERPGQGRLVIEADRARLSDLPGRGHGSLRGVEVRSERDGGVAVVRASAASGRLDRDGGVHLVDATISSGQPESVRITARNAQLSTLARVSADGVRARVAVGP